jgi:2-hydroxycyclohexanecarboxyl-CoA dehydrogenase
VFTGSKPALERRSLDALPGRRAVVFSRAMATTAGDGRASANGGDLDGHAAIVTGGGQGIGRGIALALADLGADVAVFDLNRAAAEAVADEVRKRGRRGLALEVDVTDVSRVEAATAEVAAALERLDVLVNNAGWTPNEPFAGSAPETWRRVVDVNFVGVLNCTKAALAVMIARRSGRIISVASDAARVGTPREAVYAGAKAAVMGFSKSLAAEVARYGITVNVVSPATVDTPLLRGMLTPEQIERREQANPMGRLGRPEDVAAVVAFFASPQAGYVTGQVLSVNGGVVRAG